MTTRLPQDKLDDLTLIIREWATKKWCTRKPLESLVGRLNHACSVVAHGRTFLRRLINLLRDSKRHQKFLRLNKECRLDLQWWNQFLPAWNGISFFDLPDWAPVPNFELATDASGSLGFGAYHQGKWFSATWLPSQQPLGMAYKELYPILVACHIWGPKWSRKRVLFHCDNESVVHIIKSGTSKDDHIMHLVRALFLITAKLNFHVTAAHLPGKTNSIADALSRFKFQEFFRLVPHAQPTPVEISKEVQANLTCNL